MDAQCKKVLDITNALANARQLVWKLEEQLKEESHILQDMCEHNQAHEYVAERDDDYHRPGLYFTCSICGHFTRFRPAKWRNPA